MPYWFTGCLIQPEIAKDLGLPVGSCALTRVEALLIVQDIFKSPLSSEMNHSVTKLE